MWAEIIKYIMAINEKLEQSIDKVIRTYNTKLVSELQSTLDETQRNLDDSVVTLEQEYDKIISDGNKEADKLKRQLVGSSDLKIRNQQLLLIHESITKVFDEVVSKIKTMPHDSSYESLLAALIKESITMLGTENIIISTNEKDKTLVAKILSNMSGPEMSSDSIVCMGGIRAKSKDDTMIFDNTIDARLKHMNPLIRKNITEKFRLE